MKNLLKPAVLGTTGLALLLLSACTPAAPAQAPLPGSEKSTPGAAEQSMTATGGAPRIIKSLEWPDGGKLAATRIPLEAAVQAVPGRDYEISYTTEELAEEGKHLDAFALTESGALVGGMSSSTGIDLSSDFGSGWGGIISDQVGLYENGTFTPFSGPEGRPKHHRGHQVIAGSVADGYAVWSEAVNEEPPFDNVSVGEWRITAADLATGKTRDLASSTGKTPDYLGEERLSGNGSPRPVVSENKVYWQAASTAPYADGIASPLLAAALDGSEPMAMVRPHADFPTRFKGGIAMAERGAPNHPGDPSNAITLAVAGEDDMPILRVAPDAKGEDGFTSFDGDGTIVSFTYGNEFLILDSGTRTAVATDVPADSSVVGVAHCGSTVSWTFRDLNNLRPHDSRYVYDAETSSLRVLTDPAFAGSARCGGGYISWGVGAGKDGNFKTWDIVTRWNNGSQASVPGDL